MALQHSCYASRWAGFAKGSRTLNVKNMAMRSDSPFLQTNPKVLSNRIEGTAIGYKKQAKLDGIPE